MKQKKIYIDNASTTKMAPEVLKAMLPYFTIAYGNPGSRHDKGYEAKQALDQARSVIAEILNCQTNEIIFTSGATESNNLAILGTARANKKKGKHLITSKIEHSSVLSVFEHLEKQEGFSVTYLDVDKDGLVDPENFKKAITKETILASIIYANNEIGTIEPIKELAKIAQKNNVYFHTDACQAANYLSLDTEVLGADMMTINAGKIYGPKGVGVLFCSLDVNIEPIIFGGGHENGLRSGTENIPYIVGMAKALEIAQKNKEKESKRLIKLRDFLITNILKKIPHSKLNGSFKNRLPNNINISFPGVEGKELLLHLNEDGIYASTGSACTSGRDGSSHVLSAISCSGKESAGALRLTLGRETTEEEINYVIQKLMDIVF